MEKGTALLDIANKVLGLHTLETQNTDEDFHEVAVWLLREALSQAYEAGRRAAKDE